MCPADGEPVERGMGSVRRHMRVLRNHVEEWWGRVLPVGHPVWSWLVEHATFLVNRVEVDHDGRATCGCCTGKRGRLLGEAFGELVLWTWRPVAGVMAKFACIWGKGVFLGAKAI